MKKIRPLVIGRLNTFCDGTHTLMGHLGDISGLSEREYNIIKFMDGFNSIEEISSKAKVECDQIEKIYYKFKDENKKVTDLLSWNQVGWCNECQVHVAGRICSICGNQVEPIVFDPPCDPFICFGKERKFILEILAEKFGIYLNNNSLLLANNGIKNNMFFWQVEYAGDIILRIEFRGLKKELWEYSLELTKEKIMNKGEILLSKETINKYLYANQERQNQLFTQSKAFIKECINFYPTKPLIYFSAGKESMVMLSLFEKLEIKKSHLSIRCIIRGFRERLAGYAL